MPFSCPGEDEKVYWPDENPEGNKDDDDENELRRFYWKGILEFPA